MRKTRPLPKKWLLDDCFNYNPETGIFTWKRRPLCHYDTEKRWLMLIEKQQGKEVGTYVQNKFGEPTCVSITLTVWGEYQGRFMAHRLAYVIMTGELIPEGMEIDHKNRNPWDNRWQNLRLATRTQNCVNRGRTRGRSLPKGIFRYRNKFVAKLSSSGVVHDLGAFDTPQAAAMAYHRKAVEVHGEFARTEFTHLV